MIEVFDVFLITLLVLTLIYLSSQRRPKDFPPGPFGIPLLGHLLQLGEAPFLTLQNKWKEKYGPIVGLYFGSYRTVAISDYKLIKKALLDPSLAGRPDMPMWHIRSRDTQARGLIFTEGQQNTEQRRIALKSLKEFGYGQKSFENVVTSEVLAVLDFLKNTNEQPTVLRSRFHVYILNIVWQIVAGKDCEEDRKTLTELFSNCTKVMEENNILKSLFMFMPWMSKYFPTLSGFDNANKELGSIWTFLGKHIEQHKMDSKENPNDIHDFIGAFINEMSKTEDPNSYFYKKVGDKNLMTSMLDLFFAGTDTVSNTLHWGILLLAINPQVQNNFIEEIDQVIGKFRLPEGNDESNMPYTQALIQEILRYVSIAPLGVFHSAMSDVNLQGYKIPKDTMVVLNFHAAHHDKGYWGDPEIIRPERFLSADRKSVVKHEPFFPFGQGKRVCIGETLARIEVFLFLTSIFQRFRVYLEEENQNPSLDPIVSFVLLPPNHKLIFKIRTGAKLVD